MFSNKKKEKQTEIVVTQTQSTRVTSIVRNFERRSISGASSSNFNLALPPLVNSRERSHSASSVGNTTQVDTIPIVKSNLNFNYQSPYRNSPTYSSLRTPKIRSPNVQTPATNFTKDKLVVKKTNVLHDTSNSVPTYETHSKHRGEALIINNIMFKGNGERIGAKMDEKNLKNVLKQIGFNVTVENNLKKSAMEKTVTTFSKKKSLSTADIFILVVMSHGTNNATLKGTEIFGSDDVGILTDDLLLHFNETNCKAMANKPKIFIFQCCRGDNEQFLQSDAVLKKAPVPSDALIAYSTLPGFLSHRDTEKGTWYISTLCEVLSEHAHEYHVEDLLKMVDIKLRSYTKARQTTQYDSRCFKRCYLHPR